MLQLMSPSKKSLKKKEEERHTAGASITILSMILTHLITQITDNPGAGLNRYVLWGMSSAR